MNGVCSGCNSVSCPDGCCSSGSCETPDAGACGFGGTACAPCGVVADSCASGICMCGAGAKCETGQYCDAGHCDCDPGSCPGCCRGDRTCQETPNAVNCGHGGSVCGSCGTAGNVCGADGGCFCGSGPVCGTGTQCVGGVCTCNSASCASGCCKNNICEAQGPASCGTDGGFCQVCSEADGCASDGGCLCGSGPACGAGQECDGGQCLCDNLTCNGCCMANVCVTPTNTSATACGAGGEQCGRCSEADGCASDGGCLCGAGAACGSGTECDGGQCLCDNLSCAGGCCNNGVCDLAPTVMACGANGGVCGVCTQADGCASDGGCLCGSAPACGTGQECDGGQCQCDNLSCPTGCCVDNTCFTLDAGTCAGPGAQCGACGTNADGCSASGSCQCGDSGVVCSGLTPTCLIGVCS